MMNLSSPDLDDFEENEGKISKIPGENTRRYLEFVLAQCGITASNIHSVLNLACGRAQETNALEELFPNAQILAVDSEPLSISIAESSHKQSTRTAFSTLDLNTEEAWNSLPKAQLILLQQPQLSGGLFGASGQMSIDSWISQISKHLDSKQYCIISLMCPADVEGFYDQGWGEGSTADIAKRYFEPVFEGENPHGTRGDFYYLIVLKKKR